MIIDSDSLIIAIVQWQVLCSLVSLKGSNKPRVEDIQGTNIGVSVFRIQVYTQRIKKKKPLQGFVF
jgi:hypothetical protein